jgi:hypothetical protein
MKVYSALRGRHRLLTILGLLFPLGCSDPGEEVILYDHTSFLAISGAVTEEGLDGVADVGVMVLRVGPDCQKLVLDAMPPDTVMTNETGEFLLTPFFFLGPIGSGCAELSLDLPAGFSVVDASELVVPAVFSTGVPGDTAEVSITVVRDEG